MSKRIQELFEQAESYDADHRFMAANDLCTDLLQPNNKLDPQTIQKIIQVFIKQLDDTTADIKGNAIKCLVKAISKIPENLVGQLCTKLISNIANPATPEETKNVDIYTTCLKSLINEVPENFSEIICTTLAKSGLTKRTGKAEIDEELIDLTNHLLKRFASFIYSHNNILDRDVITKDLLSILLEKTKLLTLNIENIVHEKASLRKKASLCLGSVSLILSPQQAVSVGGELVNNMIANKDKKELLYYTIGFNSMLKGAASKLGQSVKKVLPFILEDIPKRVENSVDDFDFNTELLDYYLLILDNIIKNCPQEASSYLRNIIDRLEELLSFDPNGTLAEDDFGAPDGSQEYNEEWDDAYDLGDTSWKVRRTAIQVTDTFILTHPELLKELTQRLFDKLLKRFSEQEQNVKLSVFSTFSNFLRVIVQRPFTEEAFEDLVEKPVLVKIRPEFAEFQGKVVTMIAELIKVFNDKKASSAVKVASSELLLLTTINIPDAVIQHLDAVIKLIDVNYSQTSNTIELRTNMLKILGAILKVQVVENKPQIERHYPVINKLILSSLEDKSFKLVSEGFKALTVFYRALRPTLTSTTEKFQTYVKPVIGTVNKTLKSTDIDEEIKYAVTINAVALISTFGDILSAKDLTDLLTFLLAKLKSEIKRQQVMRALSRIPSKQLDFPENVELYAVLDKFLEELFTYLRKQDRTLKILTLQVIKMILDIFKNQLPKNIQQEVLKNISALIKDDDLYLSQLSIDLLITIININPKDSKQYEEAINNCITLSKSSLARGPAVDKLTELFTAITASEIINTSTILDSLLANTNKASLIPTALCITAVLSKIKSVINPYLPIFINNLDAKKDPVLQQLSLLSVGEFGRICDLSGDKKLFDSVLALFDVQDEETKQTASVALGGICLGNIKRCLPMVIQLMNEKKDYQYLLLATLKEVITHTSYQVYEILKEQKFINFLFDYSETPNENLRPIVAECIGKLASHSISSHKDLILSNLQSPNLYRKNTIAMAFRYLCTKKTSVDELAPLIVPFLSLLNEQNLNIRRATLESLNYIAYTLPKVLQYINQSFQVSLADACKFKPELVKEIELGPFKYPVDEGLTVRNLAFSFIDTGLERILEYCGVAYAIDLIILGLGDPADDVQITSYQSLRKIINIAPLLLLPYIDKLVDRFEESVVKFDKSLNTKQEGERVKDCIRAFLRVALGLNKIEDIHNMPKFKGFYEGKVAKNDKLKDFLEQVVA